MPDRSGIEEIHPSVLFGMEPTGSVPTVSQGIATAGTVFPTHDGRRYLALVCSSQAYFVQSAVTGTEVWRTGRTFVQPGQLFAMDVSLGGTVGPLNLSMKATKSVLSDFMDIYLGCLSAVGGPLAYTITGMKTVTEIGKIKRNYSIYCEALAAFAADGLQLRNQMPIFHEQVFANLFLSRIEKDLTDKTKGLITGAIPAHKAVKPLIGVFIGKIGEDALKKMLDGVGELIREVLLKVVDHVVSTNATLTQEQVSLLASKHVVKIFEKFSRPGILQSSAEGMIREAARNAALVRPRLARILAAVNALGESA